MRITKKDVYAEWGIEYKAGKINAPLFGWINPLLTNNIDKLGKKTASFSTLAGTQKWTVTTADGVQITARGTCERNCKGCYALRGCYLYSTTKTALARRTILARLHTEWTARAIIAQIHADKRVLCRIHASGEFFDAAYIDAWKRIAAACPDCYFWTYTKYGPAGHAFDDVQNVNVVQSIIPGRGYNFGRAGYVSDLYADLKAAGKSVHACPCSVDPSKHCDNCKGCSGSDYVVFLLHGTEYNPLTDPDFPRWCEIVKNQPAA